MSFETVQVVVAVIFNTDGDVLISKRAGNVHQANRWEFPGGKIENNESAETALARELREELGISVHSSEFLISTEHDYGDKKVCLRTYTVHNFSGTPTGMESQPVKWVKICDLQQYNFPDANLKIINNLQLPQQIQITGSFESLDDLLIKSKNCMLNGITIIHFRAHELDDNSYTLYAKSLLKLCRQYGVKLILNRAPDVLESVEADGIHLTRHEMIKWSVRPCALKYLFSVSCHDESELRLAERLLADYCFLSPVKKALSHDAGAPLGIKGFSKMAAASNVPVYALGGMSVINVKEIRQAGGRGVATLSENWS